MDPMQNEHGLENYFLHIIVHIFFHGVLEDIVVALNSFLTDHMLLKKFKKIVNIHLKEVMNSRLSWCIARLLPKEWW